MPLPLRPLGKTGIKVSNLGFGAMRLPLLNPKDPTSVNVSESVRMIRHAIDSGVNYIDTAFPYHGNDHMKPGKSEEVVGLALAGGYREKVYLATKLPLWRVETRQDMDLLLNDQLKRLNVKHIDFYLAHNINTRVWPLMQELDIFGFFDAAKRDGRIRFPSFSFHDQFELFREVVGEYPWSMAQIQYNYLDVNYQAGKRGLSLANANGIGVVVMEPLRGGFLINNIPAGTVNNLKSIRPDWSMADWGLRWVWNQPEVGLVLSGMSEMAQLEENLSIAADSLPGKLLPADLTALESVQAVFRERKVVNCTACGYCMPCPCGVAIPKIFALLNEYNLSDTNDVKERAQAFYGMTMGKKEKADNCIACRICEGKCPQHIHIASMMPKATQVLETPA
ncbi:MAG: aldo/keto reductase [Planctomycetota bacterium]|jgi:predicted aldo/keto reductase-like oxidoreductase|nr:aldo/keto reductase [Planctomycetota bacterium]